MDRRERAELIRCLRRDARRIADRFDLRYRNIIAEDPRVRSRFGACYEDGLIKIRLNHARTGEPLKYSSLIDTLCHEMAHLRHFNHGPQFKELFFRMLGWARRQGIYQPGPPRVARDRAQQLADLRQAISSYNGPSRRNGVPVFVRDEVNDLQLPWERGGRSKVVTAAPVTAAPATAAPATAAPATAAPVTAAPAPQRSTLTKAPHRSSPRPPGKGRQLSLF